MKTGLLLLLLGVAMLAKAQTFPETINGIYQNVNRTPVNTGLLRDYGINFTNIEKYNGTSQVDSNKLVYIEWKQIYLSLYSMRFNSNVSIADSINVKSV
jgi:hypothetical protein